MAAIPQLVQAFAPQITAWAGAHVRNAPNSMPDFSTFMQGVNTGPGGSNVPPQAPANPMQQLLQSLLPQIVSHLQSSVGKPNGSSPNATASAPASRTPTPSSPSGQPRSGLGGSPSFAARSSGGQQPSSSSDTSPVATRWSGSRSGRWGTADRHLARFVADVTVPDGSIVAASARFTKVWRMRNESASNWPDGAALTFVGGDKLGLVDSVPAPSPPAQQDADFAVEMVAPNLPGRYVSYWRLVAPDGTRFGQRVWLDIVVPHQIVPQNPVGPPPSPLPSAANPAFGVTGAAPSPTLRDASSSVQAQAPACPLQSQLSKLVLDDSQRIEQQTPAAETSAPPPYAPIDPLAAAARPVSNVDQYAIQVDQLRDMGFPATSRVHELLARFNGDLVATVQELINCEITDLPGEQL
eukprot:TRINITY_DN4597_c0_g1_i1.p1 TRINITY_DN4597_c0_g1~~TRINITY_DN4597_c0_g1_i1.p1  ORF type:complete len:410 (+),score=115.77 TRINITY_DN4597_c0_g1_i1:763-1992(+)